MENVNKERHFLYIMLTINGLRIDVITFTVLLQYGAGPST